MIFNFRSRSKSNSFDGRSYSPKHNKRDFKESNSRNKRSRSSSKEKHKVKDKQKRSPSSSESEREKLHHTLKKAIKAAETAGKKLQQQGLLGFDLNPLSGE